MTRWSSRAIVPRVVASLVIAVGFAWTLERGGLSFGPPRGWLESLPWWALPGYVALMLVSTFSRTYRWVYLLLPIDRDLSRWRVFGMGLVGFGAAFFAPLRTGEAVRPYLAAGDGRVSFFQAAGSVAAERIVDGLVLTSFTVAAFLASSPLLPLATQVGELPIPTALVPPAMYGAFATFAALFAAMVAFYVARDAARRVVLRVVGLVSERLARWLAGSVERLSDGLSFLPSRASLVPFLAHTAGYWLLGIAAQLVLLRGAGLPASLPEACVTLGVMGLGSVLPAGPGLFGTYQLAAYTALALYYPGVEVLSSGALYVFVSYAFVLVLNAGCGLAGFALMGRFPASKGARSA